ncbi:LytTR family DNA-binding domain-containing protein [Spirosoma sp. KUDC1026]|uniref:LytTR family DNA-binding domain-containing protein n=1 Tax=Spirosoma sp. KUDC1026 TaxID=2745947 RepID=UPI00159BA615|nr:LytTR family DNA-binding domain-containing protein [Spirosoma sp. KUDC1026]QKZ14326.1 LytTR family transcriptional regulator [Spirosoma sp. KUDC1026]
MHHIRLIDLIDRIIYLSGEANYTRVHFLQDKDLIVCKTLSQCVDQLPGFIRLHKQHAINPRFLKRVTIVDSKSAHVLIGDKQLPISRRRLKDVMEQIWQSNALSSE